MVCGSAANGELEGAYGHRHSESGAIVRTGKASGVGTGNKARTFGARNPEHRKAAMLESASDFDSNFYPSYPSMRSVHQIANARRGYFEHLEQIVLVGFSRVDKRAVDTVCEAKQDAGIFVYTRTSISKINHTKVSGQGVLKRLHFVSYAVELCYQLCLARNQDVSTSGGYEAVRARGGKACSTA